MAESLLALVVPVYDAADAIWPFVEKTREALTGVDYRLVFVDDGSSEPTPHVLYLARRHFPEVEAVSLKRRSGLAAVLFAGASSAEAEWLALLGIEDDPAKVLTLFKALYALQEEKTRLVLGWRPDWKRKLFGRPGRLLLIDRELLLRLPRIESLPLFLPELVALEGFRTAVVPLETAISLKERWPRVPVALGDLFGVRWLRRRWLPASRIEPRREG